MKHPEFKTSQEAYEYAITHGKLDAHNENLISQDAKCSYNYALSILKGRFELGEPAISQHPGYSYCYSRDIFVGKLPEEWHNKMILWAMGNNKYARLYLKYTKKHENSTSRT